jgi:hypothetical protein
LAAIALCSKVFGAFRGELSRFKSAVSPAAKLEATLESALFVPEVQILRTPKRLRIMTHAVILTF